MGKHINWYLVELERALDGRMGGQELAETLNEIEAHLQDSTADLAAICRHGQDPERLAVQQFGSPLKLADRIACERGTPIGKTPLSREPITEPMIWCFALAVFLSIASHPVVCLAGAAFGVWGFCRACLRGYRTSPMAFAQAVAVAAVLAIPILALTRTGGGGDMRMVVNGDAPSIEDIERQLATVRKGLQVFAAEAPPKEAASLKSGSAYLTPMQATMPPGAQTGEPLPWSEAKKVWQTDGWPLLDSLQARAAEWPRPHVTYVSDRRGFFDGIQNWFGMVATLAFFYWGAIVLLQAGCRKMAQGGRLQWHSKAI
jgi:hypothetical protein